MLYVLLCETGDFHRALHRETAPVELDPFDFVQRFCGQVALPTVRATYHRYVFDNKQVSTLAVSPSDPAYLRTLLAAYLTYHLILYYLGSSPKQLMKPQSL
jgi:hypothetical protein